jgi:NADH:ubiquinone reductase (H+-translocating)
MAEERIAIPENWPRVVIIGAGFAGINAARALGNFPVRVTLIDRKNYHLFQPLLYQVALAVLSPGEIASPARGILRKFQNVEVLMDEALGFDLERRCVKLKETQEIGYDYLVIAAGATHSYFGHDEWAELAPGLKTSEDATEIRRRVLLAFELAERETAVHGMTAPLNFVVVGGGPTGVELAGAISDITRHVLSVEFRAIDPSRARVTLLEGGPRVLAAYTPDLSEKAEKQLRDLGVEVYTNAMVTQLSPGKVTFKNKDGGFETINSVVTLWGAGVKASHLGKALGVETDRTGRVLVDEYANVSGHHDVFVIGDLAAFKQGDGYLAGVAPVAIQMGKYVAAAIKRDVEKLPRKRFHYLDKGTMATIGRSKAIAQIGKLHLSGFLAWAAWLFVHILFLIGFRNRLAVLAEWMWAYFTFQRGARLITGSQELIGWREAEQLPAPDHEEQGVAGD